MASVAGFGILIHHRIDFAGLGGQRDPPLFVEQADPPYAGLAAQSPNDVVQRIPVVVQHLLVRAAQNHVRHPVGRLFDQILGVAALHTQVDIPEQRKESRRARDHADRELGGQSQAGFDQPRHYTSTGSASVSSSSEFAASCGAPSKTAEFCAMKWKIAKPAATIESVLTTSLP